MQKIKTVCEVAKEYFKLKHLKSDIVVDNQGRMVACPDHKKAVRLNLDGAIEVFQPPGRAEYKPIDGIKYVPLMAENQVCLFRDFSKDNFILVLDENMQERSRFHVTPDEEFFGPIVYKDMIIFRYYKEGEKLTNVELSRNRDIFYSWKDLKECGINKRDRGLIWENNLNMALLAMDIRGNTLWEYTPDYGDMKFKHHLIGNGNILVGVYIAGLLEEFHVLDYTGKVVNVIVPPKYFPGQHYMETEIFKDEQGNTCIYFYHGRLSDEHESAYYVITLDPNGQECSRAGGEKHLYPTGFLQGSKLLVCLVNMEPPYNNQMGIFNIKEDSIKAIPWKEEDLHSEIISNNEGVFAASGWDLYKLNSDWGKEWEIHVGSFIHDYKVRGDYIYISSGDKFGIYKVGI